ncbi:MAG: lysophospholipid acyltransferase family protein [Anaerovorax sp.]|nr:lysophospholipid acyltransferase family protein [Anaerovorax sp.]
MKLLKNVLMGMWMYWDLIHIHHNKVNIHKYRAQGNFEAERKEISIGESTWGKNLIRKVGVTVRAEGQENIPEGAVVFVANHQSYADIAVLTSVIDFKQFGFIAKENLRKLPAFGEWIYDVRSVFIKREDPRASLRAIEKGIEYLGQGFSMGIFPEGTRSKGPNMGEFKRGSLRLATKPGVPVVPITISGTYKLFEEKGYATPAEVNVYIHPMIETKDMDKKEASELAERVEKIIRDKLVELQR